MRHEARARGRTRSAVLGIVAATLCTGPWSAARGQERRGACDTPGEVLAVYDCRTGLVLWTRRQADQTGTAMPTDGELCRLVAGQVVQPQSSGQCL